MAGMTFGRERELGAAYTAAGRQGVMRSLAQQCSPPINADPFTLNPMLHPHPLPLPSPYLGCWSGGQGPAAAGSYPPPPLHPRCRRHPSHRKCQTGQPPVLRCRCRAAISAASTVACGPAANWLRLRLLLLLLSCRSAEQGSLWWRAGLGHRAGADHAAAPAAPAARGSARREPPPSAAAAA